jgi:hypothetical protein
MSLYLPHSEKKDSETGKKGSYYGCVSWRRPRVELILTTKNKFFTGFLPWLYSG